MGEELDLVEEYVHEFEITKNNKPPYMITKEGHEINCQRGPSCSTCRNVIYNTTDNPSKRSTILSATGCLEEKLTRESIDKSGYCFKPLEHVTPGYKIRSGA